MLSGVDVELNVDVEWVGRIDMVQALIIHGC